MARPKPVHYVSNKELYKSMVLFIASIREAEAKGLERPQIPKDIGEAIWKIAENLGTKGNFSGYTYIDEMKGDGIENCIQYIHNFNPERYNNPFAYFTKIIWFAFLRRIEREKKETLVKYRLSVDSLHTHLLHGGGERINVESHEHTPEIHEKMAELSEKFESNKTKAKVAPKKKQGIEKFTGESDEGEHPTNHSKSN